jgi:predicted regulator of Ras-like GTPase activity (Roadblock/LC7/MglB family)
MTSGVELSWLLDDLVTRVPQIEKVVILSRDGLAVAASASLGREDAERLAAIAAGLHSLARGAAGPLGGGQASQVIVEMDSAFLFVTAAGAGSSLAVVSSGGAEVGLIAYEMALLAKRVADYLSVRPRAVSEPGEAM